MAAVSRTTASVPGPRSCIRYTRISHTVGLFGLEHSFEIHFPINQAIRLLTMGKLASKDGQQMRRRHFDIEVYLVFVERASGSKLCETH